MEAKQLGGVGARLAVTAQTALWIGFQIHIRGMGRGLSIPCIVSARLRQAPFPIRHKSVRHDRCIERTCANPSGAPLLARGAGAPGPPPGTSRHDGWLTNASGEPDKTCHRSSVRRALGRRVAAVGELSIWPRQSERDPTDDFDG
jgi:hypothetical protein